MNRAQGTPIAPLTRFIAGASGLTNQRQTKLPASPRARRRPRVPRRPDRLASDRPASVARPGERPRAAGSRRPSRRPRRRPSRAVGQSDRSRGVSRPASAGVAASRLRRPSATVPRSTRQPGSSSTGRRVRPTRSSTGLVRRYVQVRAALGAPASAMARVDAAATSARALRPIAPRLASSVGRLRPHATPRSPAQRGRAPSHAERRRRQQRCAVMLAPRPCRCSRCPAGTASPTIDQRHAARPSVQHHGSQPPGARAEVQPRSASSSHALNARECDGAAAASSIAGHRRLGERKERKSAVAAIFVRNERLTSPPVCL